MYCKFYILKVGEEEFVRQARIVKRYGAAVIIMAFDENGQALHLKKKSGFANARTTY